MRSLWKTWVRDESGQVLVLFALLLTVIFGFTALAIDVGGMVVAKSRVQNAADAAALAGAQDLPNTSAFTTAKNFAEKNGVPKEKTIAQYYKDDEGNTDTNKIYVECEVDYDFTFARVLGFKDTKIGAIAVAQKQSKWEGEALPFINLAFDYETEDPTAWTHLGSGIKGTIVDFFTRNADTDDPYFEIDYTDGITVTPGYSNGTKGIDGSKLKDALEKILTPSDMGVKKIYLFSLSSKVIKSGQFTVNNKTKTVSLNSLNKLKNGDVVDPDQLVLIECLFLDCKWSNQHDIELKFLGNVFDLGNDDPDNPLPDFPTENLSSGGASKLIQ